MNNENILSSERAEKIIEIIKEKGTVSVSYLSDFFHVSGTTIRTDLTRLEESGAIVRTHGGAMLRSSIIREMSMSERANNVEKNLIASEAVRLIHDSDTILIDTGTTMTAFARVLVRSALKNLRIFTIDFEVAGILESNPEFEIRLIGGRVRNGFHYCYGHQVIEELKKYNFEKLFLATSAIDKTCGLTTSNVDLAELKSTMVHVAGKVVLLSDSSKVGRIDFQKFADIQDIDLLITDNHIRPDYLQSFGEKLKKIIVSTPSASSDE
ncbi:MAG: DeoR/GlpR family DNA-binding transcription regulator [Lachnospiraceae bacterium]|nr:DeoR/GlpR family DNA-binding transcription regulator [Robinsoniella sp.]MDY3766422.1 DeoR/GlpR family DNA-binding transcription regulator [Lachnospiraceae bacterium]